MVLKGRGRISINKMDGKCYLYIPYDLRAGRQWFFGDNEEVLVELHREDQTLVVKKIPQAEMERLREKLEFYCPRCKDSIKPLEDSGILGLVFDGSRSIEEGLYYLKIAHYRHKHTGYEESTQAIRSKYEERAQTDGFFDREMYDTELDQIKIFANERARKLLEEDGFL